MYIAIESRVTGRECVYESNSAKLSGLVVSWQWINVASPFMIAKVSSTTTVLKLEVFCTLLGQS